MSNNSSDLSKDADKLFNEKKYDEITALLTYEVLEKEKNAELYVRRGIAWYYNENYNSAMKDYNKAIEIDHKYALAFYNRGFLWIQKKEYEKAIKDYDTVINFVPKWGYVENAYILKAFILGGFKRKYDDAIACFDEAIKINPDFENAYYNRGLAKKEINNLKGSCEDFKKYIELMAEKNDIWTKNAHSYIEELNKRIDDEEFSDIFKLCDKIKKWLLIKTETDWVTHYTSLNTLKSLILGNSKFRISEGNFMNDPSEGKILFDFLNDKITSCNNDSLSETFSPKPFVGSFVDKEKDNDLNMWRFYGKEGGIEANGCSITLNTKKFIEDINISFLKKEKGDIKYESDINFYKVAYFDTKNRKFYISGLSESDVKNLNKLMVELKEKVSSYNNESDNKKSLEKYLNSITFLFKSDAYKNENEVRLVVKGMEFEKKYNKNVIPPRVYIELVSIKEIVEQITLGPKIDKVNEWAAVFHYSYDIDAPKVIISRIPYR